MSQQRPPGIAAAVVGVLLLVTVAGLVTNVGTGGGHYRSAPDPCQLLSDETVSELITEPLHTSQTDRAGGPRWFEPHYQAERRACTLTGQRFSTDRDGQTEASIRIAVNRYTDTQLGLGPTGVERAQQLYRQTRDELREHEQAECLAAVTDARAEVCGVPTRQRNGFTLLIRRENAYVHVGFDGGLVSDGGPVTGAEYDDRWLEQRMADATSQILAQLDQPQT